MPKQVKHANLLITALFAWIVFLVADLTIRSYDLFRILPLVDTISHFLSGIAIAVTFYWIISSKQARKRKATVLFFTILTAIVWEILEMLEELVIENPAHLKDIFFWDGF